MRVAVLGGGLQGACVAMELGSAGVAVDLYDKNDRCMTQASAQNEGKIHLGYVYANDRSLRTARTMIQGGISFAPLMRRWLGDDVDTLAVSAPFHYVVHRDSLLGVAAVEAHFRASHALALDEARGRKVDYFGSDYRVPPQRLARRESEALFDPRTAAAAFATNEIAIDPEALAEMVRARLASDTRVRSLLRAHVHGVELGAGAVTVDVEIAGSRSRERYDHVVNALWDGRLTVDQTAGIESPPRPWLYRVKHYVRLRARASASRIPSTTIVLGAFGDIAAYENGSFYLSWYPAGMRGSSAALSPPAWPLVLDDAAAREMRRSILTGLADLVPSAAALTGDAVESAEIRAGIIFAWGSTGIDDPDSGLHERHAIGPVSQGRYHTVDTGKLTMAPLFGKMVADRIRQMG